MSSTILAPLIFPTSKIRRKPAFTYKSPSANDVDPLITSPCPDPSSRPSSTQNHSIKVIEEIGLSPRKRARAGNYSLPLYHPLGELASSLPPLNPADFGLPLPRLPKGIPQGPPGRFQRFSARNTDGGEEGGVPTVSSIAAVAASEMKRTNPRKKRASAGNGKRRRRDVDDGDANYPAKRTRQTRAGGGDDNDFDDTPAQEQGEGDGISEADGLVERRPERRSTRSRAKRRDSSEVSVEEQPGRDSASATEDNTRPSTLEGISEDTGEEREEGEVEGR